MIIFSPPPPPMPPLIKCWWRQWGGGGGAGAGGITNIYLCSIVSGILIHVHPSTYFQFIETFTSSLKTNAYSMLSC